MRSDDVRSRGHDATDYRGFWRCGACSMAAADQIMWQKGGKSFSLQTSGLVWVVFQ